MLRSQTVSDGTKNIWPLQSATTRKSCFQVAEQKNQNSTEIKYPEQTERENYFNGGPLVLAKVRSCVPNIHKFSACWQSGHISWSRTHVSHFQMHAYRTRKGGIYGINVCVHLTCQPANLLNNFRICPAYYLVCGGSNSSWHAPLRAERAKYSGCGWVSTIQALAKFERDIQVSDREGWKLFMISQHDSSYTFCYSFVYLFVVCWLREIVGC